MSQRELLKLAKSLSVQERKYLRAYLWMLDRIGDPAWKAEMARRRRRMEEGHAISSTEYHRRVRALDQSKARKRKAA